MNRDYYSFSFNETEEKDYYYFFTSIGKNGNILKLTVFQCVEATQYNMALVDYNAELEEGNDTTISDNQDMPKVLATVAYILFDFLAKVPEASVFIEANSAIKRKLYNRIMKNNLQDLPTQCEVWGILENKQIEPFANNDYTSIIIQRKKL